MPSEKRIYFHIIDPNLGNEFHPVYQYDYIPLAQGLKKMGWIIHSNRNYWKGLGKDYLFQHEEAIKPDDCQINVFSGMCSYYHYPFDEDLFRSRNTLKILIDQNDGFFTPLFDKFSRKFDLIFHKKCRNRNYPSNCVSSWGFGISEEILTIARQYETTWEKRKHEILCNFRYGHSVRRYALSYLEKLQLRIPLEKSTDEFEFSQYEGTPYYTLLRENGGRHRPEYIQRISNSTLCATFGGFFYFDSILDKNDLTFRLGNYLLPDRAGGQVVDLIKRVGLHLSKTKSIYQWDSWRFWEAFVGGAVNLNVDLNVYGIELPEMPINGKHYIGLNFNRGRTHNSQLLDLTSVQFKKIATAGHAWALENYSPEAMALRFINLCGK